MTGTPKALLLSPDWEWRPIQPGQEVIEFAHDPKDPMILRVTVSVPVPSAPIRGVAIHNIGDPGNTT